MTHANRAEGTRLPKYPKYGRNQLAYTAYSIAVLSAKQLVAESSC